MKNRYAMPLCALVLAMTLVIPGCSRKKTESNASGDWSSSLSSNDWGSSSAEFDGSSGEESGDASSSKSNAGSNSCKSNGGSSSSESGGSSSSKKKDSAVRNLNGRTITFLAEWEEPKKGNSERENLYWERKTYVEKTFNCKFVHKVATGDWYANWMASVMADQPTADIICCKKAPYSAINSGLLYDLSKLDEFDFSEDKWSRMVNDMGNVNGKIYTMYSIKYEALNFMLYNKDILKKNGQTDLWTLQKAGKLTLNKLVEIAKACSSTGKPGMAADITPYYAHMYFAQANGGRYITRSGKTLNFSCTINSQAVLKGFNAAQELVNSGVLYNGKGMTSWTYVRERFVKGDYAIMLGGDISDAFENAKFDVGICSIPTTDGKMLNVKSDGQWCAIAYNARKPDEIALVWDLMTDVIFDVNYKVRYQDLVSDDAMEYINTVAKQQSGGMEPDYQFIGDVYKNGIYELLMDMVNGGATPAQTIQKIEPVYKAEIASLK